MKFHQTRYHYSKDIRPDMESPWSVDFKTTITFKFTTHLSWVLACQRYFTIPSRCAEMAKNRQKMPDFTWNSTNLKVPKVQKKIYPHFLHTKRHSKNTSHLTKSNVCFFQHYLLSNSTNIHKYWDAILSRHFSTIWASQQFVICIFLCIYDSGERRQL